MHIYICTCTYILFVHVHVMLIIRVHETVYGTEVYYLLAVTCDYVAS